MKINKKQKNQITATLILSLVLFIIPILGIYVAKSTTENAFIALAVTQLGIFLIWLVMRSGLFATSSFGNRRYFRSVIKDKNESVGGYHIKDKTKTNIAYKDNPNQIEEESKDKPKIGIYVGLSIGLLELVISLIISFS